MRKNPYLRYFVTIVLAGLMCYMMTGCGVRDTALTIPIGNGRETVAPVAEKETEYSPEMTVQPEIKTETGAFCTEAGSETTSDRQETVIYVYVCGAVQDPGVVELPEGSRADDALRAAGGFAHDAQTDFVNLAAMVTDGEKLYFPCRGEMEELVLAEQEKQDGLVNINTADSDELMTLPGIGESRAQDIISYRETHGSFRTKEELKNVPGIKENVYAKLCEKIST